MEPNADYGTLHFERVNMGYYAVDCSTCGLLGVWPSRKGATLANAAHKCPPPNDGSPA